MSNEDSYKCWYLGPPFYRVLAAQRQGNRGCHTTHRCPVSSVLFFLSGKACLCSVTISMRIGSCSSSCVTSQLYSWISAIPRSAVSFVTWIPCTNSLAIRSPGWSFHESGDLVRNFWSIFILRKKWRVFFVAKSAKQLFEKSFLRASLGGSLSPSLSSAATIRHFMSPDTSRSKKAKATIFSERYQSWPENLFSTIVPSTQLFTPLNKGV